jgi:hypothetical protein
MEPPEYKSTAGNGATGRSCGFNRLSSQAQRSRFMDLMPQRLLAIERGGNPDFIGIGRMRRTISLFSSSTDRIELASVAPNIKSPADRRVSVERVVEERHVDDEHLQDEGRPRSRLQQGVAEQAAEGAFSYYMLAVVEECVREQRAQGVELPTSIGLDQLAPRVLIAAACPEQEPKECGGGFREESTRRWRRNFLVGGRERRWPGRPSPRAEASRSLQGPASSASRLCLP